MNEKKKTKGETLREGLALVGEFTATLRIQNMFIDREIKIPLGKNMIVNTGLELALTRLKDASLNPVSHMAIGTSSTSESTTQTALGAETTRKSATITVNTSSYFIQAQATFSSTEINGTQEIGVFNASSGGKMFARKVVSPAIQIPSGFNMTLTHKATLSRA